MQRREFIRLATNGSAALLVPNLLYGCRNRTAHAYEGWLGHARSEPDVRIATLAYAVLAPNPRNIQPWLVELDGSAGLALYIDPTRLLSETDPTHRQVHIAQGTFVENLDLAARRMGYRADIDWFPEGVSVGAVLEPKPVARIALHADASIEDDPLFDVIIARRSNQRPYDGRPLAPAFIEGLEAICRERGPCSLGIRNDPDTLATLCQIAREATRIEVEHPARSAEALAMFRFDEDEIERHRDGFGIATAGVTGLRRWVAESFLLSRASAERDPGAFAARAIDLVTEQASTASAFGWLVTASNSRLDQVQTGRVYERLALAAASACVDVHPLSQVLQDYPGMAALRRRFKRAIGVPETHTVQMLFRLGYAEPTQHTARRELSDFLVATGSSRMAARAGTRSTG